MMTMIHSQENPAAQFFTQFQYISLIMSNITNTPFLKREKLLCYELMNLIISGHNTAHKGKVRTAAWK